MSKTYGDVLSQIQSAYSRGVASDDSRLRRRYMLSLLNRKRALLVKREYLRNAASLSPTTKQKINCLQLEEAPIIECPCTPEELKKLGCKIMKSKVQIPALISANTLYSVTSTDGSIQFDETSFRNAKLMLNQRYSFLRGKRKYYFSNGYIYIINDTLIQYISVEGLFEDPQDVAMLNAECGGQEHCDIYETIYPLESYLLEPAITLTLEEILKTWNSTIEDKTNDQTETNVSRR